MKFPVCPVCGFENPEHTRFCQNCGSAVFQKSSFTHTLAGLHLEGLAGTGGGLTPMAAGICEQPGSAPRLSARVIVRSDGSWYCPDCGHKNVPHTPFCTVCGRDL